MPGVMDADRRRLIDYVESEVRNFIEGGLREYVNDASRDGIANSFGGFIRRQLPELRDEAQDALTSRQIDASTFQQITDDLSQIESVSRRIELGSAFEPLDEFSRLFTGEFIGVLQRAMDGLGSADSVDVGQREVALSEGGSSWRFRKHLRLDVDQGRLQRSLTRNELFGADDQRNLALNDVFKTRCGVNLLSRTVQLGVDVVGENLLGPTIDRSNPRFTVEGIATFSGPRGSVTLSGSVQVSARDHLEFSGIENWSISVGVSIPIP